LFKLKREPCNDNVIARNSLSVVSQYLIFDSFDGPLMEGFSLYILLNSLADHNEDAKAELKENMFLPDEKKAFDFLKLHCGRIEIAYEESLLRTYFPIKPICHFLSDQSKDKLMLKVPREDANEKVQGLMEAAPNLIEEMKHNEKLSRSRLKIVTPKTLNIVRDFSTVIAVVINCLMLFFKKFNYDNANTRTTVILDEEIRDIIVYLGYIQLASSIIVLLFYIYSKAALIAGKKWRERVKNNI
jgi:hypothetical protein